MLFQKEPNQADVESAIGLIAHGKIQPGFLVHNTFVVTKGIKTGLAVVRTHAAFSNTAKSHGRGSQMDDTVIDTSAAETAPGCNLSDALLIFGEDVKRQRLFVLIDGLDHLIYGVEGQNRQNRPEDLLFHNRIIPTDRTKNGGFDF